MMTNDDKDWADIIAAAALSDPNPGRAIAEFLRQAEARGYSSGYSSGERTQMRYPRQD